MFSKTSGHENTALDAIGAETFQQLERLLCNSNVDVIHFSVASTTGQFTVNTTVFVVGILPKHAFTLEKFW